MAYWKWSEKARRYYVTAEGAKALGRKAGTFIGGATVDSISERLIDRRKISVLHHAIDIDEGAITIQKWFDLMSRDVKDIYIQQYLLARGGRDSMTPSDWGRLGGLIRGQRIRLHAFAERIANGEYSVKQIANYSRMYIGGSQRAYEMAKTAARGMPDLPVYPGDGGTPCLTNCRCHWKIVDRGNYWECTWMLGQSEHCQGCLDRQRQYASLIIPKPIELRLNTSAAETRQLIP